MKKSFSKRMLSIVLSVLMIVTTIPAFTMTVDADVNLSVDDKYIFAYFTGDNEGQHINFALSSDGINFSPLNGNAPVLNEGTNNTEYPTNNIVHHNTYYSHVNRDGYSRDPFIFRKKNLTTGEDATGHYIVATDLHVGDSGQTGDYNNSRIYVWDVNDLSQADQVTPWIIETTGFFGTKHQSNNNYIAWAPEIAFDYSRNMYILFWSGPDYYSSDILYAYTTDFKTFKVPDNNGDLHEIDGTTYKPATLYTVSGTNTIDGDIVFDADDDEYGTTDGKPNGAYYLFYKYENEYSIYCVKSPTITGFNGRTSAKINISGDGLQFEGPECYQRGDGRWVLITDMYKANPTWDFYMFVVDDLDEFLSGDDFAPRRVTTTNINDCLPRHGAVASIDNETYNKLAVSYAIPTAFRNKQYTGTAIPTFPDGNSTSTSNMSKYSPSLISNVLYSSNGIGGNSEAESDTLMTVAWVWNMKAKFNVEYANNTVVLYDGTNPIYIPALTWTFKNNSDNYVYIFNVYPSGNEISVLQRWRGGDSRNTSDFVDCMVNGTSYIGYTSSDLVACNPISNDKHQHYASAIVVNGANLAFTNGIKRITGTTWTATAKAVKDKKDSASNPSSDTKTFSLTDRNNIYVINYKPIYDAIDTVISTFNTVTANNGANLDSYCPESLDAYLSAVSKVTRDPNSFFALGDYHDACAEYYNTIINDGTLQLAKDGPQKARIQYGNVFDFDAYAASGSINKNALTSISTDRTKRIVAVTGTGDAYSSDALSTTTYRLPVEPGESYIFEYTTFDADGNVSTSGDNQYADAMVFIPNKNNTAYNLGNNNAYAGWRLHGAGTQKILITVPTQAELVAQNAEWDYDPSYVFFRVGVNSSATEVTARIGAIRFYKAEYENWASFEPSTIPSGRIETYLNNLKGISRVRPTSYGQALAEGTDLQDTSGNVIKHFVIWCKDEALTQPVSDTSTLIGCTTLYAKFDTHSFKWNRTDSNTAKFPCTFDSSESTNELATADAEVYNYLEMIYPTLDLEKYNDNAATLKSAKAIFDAMKTTEFKLGEKPADDTSSTVYYTSAQQLVDASVTALLNAMNTDEKTYNLDFYVYVDGVEVKHNQYSRQYNDVVDLDATSYVSGGVCQAWTVATSDDTSNTEGYVKAIPMYDPSNEYSVKLQSNTVVKAYYTSESATNVVSLQNQYGHTLYQFSADSITISGKTVTANGTTYTVPDMPYMLVTGFMIDNALVSDGTYSITAPTVVKAKCNPTEGNYIITLDGNTIEGDYKYDSRVTVTAPAGAYAIATVDASGEHKIVAYADSGNVAEYSFFANRSIDFYTVTKSGSTYSVSDGYTFTQPLDIHKLDYRLPFVYSAAMNTDTATNRYTTFNAFSTNSNVTIIEVGTVYVKEIRTTDDSMRLESDGIYKSISKTQIDFSNQYSLSMKGAVGNTLTTRAYVKYQYNDGSRDITAIEYGNITNAQNLG